MTRLMLASTLLMGMGCQEYDLRGREPEEPPEMIETTDTAPEPPDTGTAEEPDGEPPEEPGMPVALCDVAPNPVAAIYEEATWIGSASYDPDGRPLTYAWQLVSVPTGSQPGAPIGGPLEPERPGFVADLVGIYTGELIVTNDLGVASEPCQVDLEAIPATDLWVEMFWAERGDDMDLHLVRDDGNINSNQDCYYMNCRRNGLPWGPAGIEGNPFLDIDDIPGTGPENINILAPEDLTYEVWVHDYPSARYQPANAVTVKIYLSGALAWTDTRELEGEDSTEHFATVDWATQSVTPR